MELDWPEAEVQLEEGEERTCHWYEYEVGELAQLPRSAVSSAPVAVRPETEGAAITAGGSVAGGTVSPGAATASFGSVGSSEAPAIGTLAEVALTQAGPEAAGGDPDSGKGTGHFLQSSPA